MKKMFKIFMLAGLVSLAAIPALAQSSGSNSPYSRYGWGTLSDESMGFNKGMGGLALGIRDPYIINRQNPASYSAFDSLTFMFDAGVSLQACHLNAGSTKVNANNSTLDYAAAAFRFGKGLGFSMGIRPFTTVGYSFSNSSDLDDIDGYGEKTTSSTYTGEGGIHQVYMGLGYSPVKFVSVGVNVGYLWGDYTHTSKVSYSESAVQTLSRTYKATINTPTVDFGLQLQHKINKKDKVTLGATYGLGHKINQRATFINLKQASSSTVGGDTVNVKDAFQLPTTLGVGVSWNHDDHIMVGFDYTMQMWKNCRFPELNNSTYEVNKNSLLNRHKFVLGGEYIPNPHGLKVRDHICYRLGASYTTPYTKVNGKDGAKSYAISAGVGIPIVTRYNNRSSVNIALQWEHVDASALKSIKEDYLRLSIGLSFNAKWFDKWKVE